METKNHPATPLPWTAHGLGISGRIDPVGRVHIGRNRTYIAHACNAYPDLVEALGELAYPHASQNRRDIAQTRARELLRKLKEVE